VESINLPAAFLLVAVLDRPAKTPPHAEGTFAPSLLMNTNLPPTVVLNPLIGATCQFRVQGDARLNVPGESLQRAPIALDFQAKILDPEHPSTLGLAFKVDRTVAPIAGIAWLLVDNTTCDARVTDCFPRVRL
jgi:hypothetical protein